MADCSTGQKLEFQTLVQLILVQMLFLAVGSDLMGFSLWGKEDKALGRVVVFLGHREHCIIRQNV